MKYQKLLLLIFSLAFICVLHAQNIHWMLGTWKGSGDPRKLPVIRTLDIRSVNENNFSGTRTIEVKDRNHTQIVTNIVGHISRDSFYVRDDSVVFKNQAKNKQWISCAACTPVYKALIKGDSIHLTIIVSNCAPECNGVFTYFKMLPDFDTSTQVAIVKMLGTPDQIAAFSPIVNPPPVASSDPDAVKKDEQKIQDSIDKAERIAKKLRQQQIDDSLQLAKKHQQQIADSLKAIADAEKKRLQQHIQDSLDNAARIAKERQRIQDSIDNALAIAKKIRQQQIDDSIKVAKVRQQQIADSLKTVADAEKKKLQQHIQDSLDNAARTAKERQRIQDSIDNALAIAKKIRQQQIDDSIKVAKVRQQQITDSLKTVADAEKKRLQQHIQDSIITANNLAKERQRIQDSINNALAIAKKIRQQQIADSIKVAKVRQQQIADSLKTVADAEKKRLLQHMQDSIANAALLAKQRQHVQDSLNAIAEVERIKQQEIQDSVKLASAKQHMIDTAKAVTAKGQTDKTKALTQRDNVLLQTYHIKNPDILIELFDNAEIDGDRVSVFHNNQVIINNQMLTHDPIVYKVHADSSNRTHEFVLVAENLGTIPPNTALMRVTADNQVYKLSVRTDLKTNAKIVFYYDGN